MRSATRPRLLGQATRGKTAPNRLRQTDTFLAVAFAGFLGRLPGVYVDLGYGAYPVTSVETLHRLRPFNPALRVLGVEIDPARVAEALPYAEPGLDFRLGGFNLPLRPDERAGVIRAFNVLRQYDAAAVAEALAALALQLAEGGLLIEGTCDPAGQLLTFNLYQKQSAALARAGLVLAPRLRSSFRPRQLQAVLPKNFIHHAEPGGPIDRFFGAWQACWQGARAQGRDARQVFAHSAHCLAERHGYRLDRRPALLRRGFLWLGSDWPAAHPGG